MISENLKSMNDTTNFLSPNLEKIIYDTRPIIPIETSLKSQIVKIGLGFL